ncbi:MAG: translocation/assembly module TamB domain-containing protein [Deltaproteobacteria bacterium]|nr:translocation/assembly module TamB domain-containing protein [Deltaproteobacteria bacterium]
MIRRILALLTALFILTLCLLSFLLFSRTGFDFALSQVASRTGGSVTIGTSSEGRILGDWQLQDVTVTADAVTVRIGVVRVEWHPLKLLRRDVHIVDIAAQEVEVMVADEKTKSGEQTKFDGLPKDSVPVGFIINRLSIDNGSLHLSDSKDGPFVLNHLSFSLVGREENLQLNDFELKTPLYGASLTGKLTMSGSWPLLVNGSWWYGENEDDQFHGRFAVGGPLETVDLSVSVIQPIEAELTGSVKNMLQDLSWHLQGRALQVNPNYFVADWPDFSTDLSIKTQGALHNYQGIVEATLKGSGLPADLSLHVQLSGNEDGIEIDSGTIDSGRGRVNLTADVKWQEGIAWEGSIGAQKIDLSLYRKDLNGVISAEIATNGMLSDKGLRYWADITELYAVFPEPAVSVSGALHLQGDDTGIVINSGTLDSAKGELTITGSLNWQQMLTWNSSITLKLFDLSLVDQGLNGVIDAEITTNGMLGDEGLRYWADITELHAVIPAPIVNVSGAVHLQGDEAGLEILSSRLTSGESELTVTGQLAWLEAISWDALIEFDRFNPAMFGAYPAGTFNAELKSRGNVKKDDISTSLSIDSLDGMLAGYELTGTGEIDYRSDILTIDDLHLVNGGNELQIDGKAGQELNLTFSLDGRDLGRLLPLMNGDVTLSGILTGSQEHPVVNAYGRGVKLSYQDYFIDDVAGSLKIGLTADGSVEARLDGKQLRVAGKNIASISSEVNGGLKSHRIGLTIDSDFGDLRLFADGQLDDLERWHGIVQNIVYTHPVYGSWRQKDSAVLDLSSTDVKLKNLCVSSDASSVCSGASWKEENAWAFALTDIDFFLPSLKEWGMIGDDVTGRLQGHMTAEGSGAVLVSANGSLAVPELSMMMDTSEFYDQLTWFDTFLSIGLSDEVLQTSLSSRFIDNSSVEAAVEIEGFGSFAQPTSSLPLRGHMNIEVKDLRPLSVLTEDYLVPSGHVVADLEIEGVVGAPLVNGSVNLTEGKINFPQLGITLTDVLANISGDGNLLGVDLDAVSGDGQAHGKGNFTFNKAGWSGKFKITSDYFEVADLGELHAIVDSDLELTIGSNGGGLNGKLFIPRALIAPEEMTGSVSESRDVIFVDEQSAGPKWPFTLSLRAELGDDVHVDGYGLAGNLRGKLAVADGQGGGITGRGELYLDQGTFSIYDRSLEISRGRVLFDGGAIDNPGLDISARRVIKETPLSREEIIVGINVTGSVFDYKVELFSIPDMDDSEIIAYIVLDKSTGSVGSEDGSLLRSATQALGLSVGDSLLDGVSELGLVDDISFSTGDASEDVSLVVGRRLTEQLYISYDFNVFRNAGFFNVRYDFGKGFSVESKNSTQSNRVSFIYSFER